MTGRGKIAVHTFSPVKTERGTLLAETRVGDVVHQSWLRGTSPPSNIEQIMGGQLAEQTSVPPKDAIFPDPADLNTFRGLNVLLAIRVSEERDALGPWLRWHQDLGYTAALIIDCAGDLTRADLEDTALRVGMDTLVAVSSTLPLLTDGPRKTIAERVIVEAVRHRYLSEANMVVCVGLSDLMLRKPDELQRQVSAGDGLIELAGRAVFPWRLRKKVPAPFHDHIYAQSPQQMDRLSWAAAPAQMDPEARWLPSRIHGVKPAKRVDDVFLHAVGVAHPGVDTKELIDKAALREDRVVADTLARVFGAAPLRRKEIIPPGTVGDDTTIVTAMKNEGPFILDWIAHHRAIGVDRFLVFSNDCEDGTDALLDTLAQHGVVEHHRNPYRDTGKVPQRAAFDAAQRLDTVQKSGWLMTLDVDEYLNIQAGDGRLSDLRHACADANVFSIPWRLFGSSDVERFEDRPVTHQFDACAPAYCPRPHQAWGFKTLYRNAGFFRRLGVHRPLGLANDRLSAVHWVNGSGQPLPQRQWRKAWRMTGETWGYDLATVNHYAVRSAESYLVKRHRGRVNHTTRDQGTAYWFRMNQNAERDTSIRRIDDRVAEERDALLTLPRVGDLHAAAVDWHHRKIAALKADPTYADLFSEITGDKLRKLSRMPGRFGSNVFLAGPESVPDDVLNRPLDEKWMFTITKADRKD